MISWVKLSLVGVPCHFRTCWWPASQPYQITRSSQVLPKSVNVQVTAPQHDYVLSPCCLAPMCCWIAIDISGTLKRSHTQPHLRNGASKSPGLRRQDSLDGGHGCGHCGWGARASATGMVSPGIAGGWSWTRWDPIGFKGKSSNNTGEYGKKNIKNQHESTNYPIPNLLMDGILKLCVWFPNTSHSSVDWLEHIVLGGYSQALNGR